MKPTFLRILALAVTLTALALSSTRALADIPQPGTPAPEFTLVTGEGKPASLSDYRGKWVVLYFYPRNFTSGCTIEAQNFQRDIEKYEQRGAVILGVSVDTAESHKEFCAAEGLSFTLLADIDGKVSGKYGSAVERNGSIRSARNTFIINPEGRIAHVFTQVSPTGHSEETLATLANLQRR